jgi:hypothetical protein
LLALYVHYVLVGEVEFYARSDGGVDDELRRIVLRSSTSDTVKDGILACESFLEGVERVVVDGLGSDVRIWWCGVGRCRTRDGCDVEAIGIIFEKVGDDGCTDIASRLLGLGQFLWSSKNALAFTYPENSNSFQLHLLCVGSKIDTFEIQTLGALRVPRGLGIFSGSKAAASLLPRSIYHLSLFVRSRTIRNCLMSALVNVRVYSSC